jgi:Uncharacterized protein containing LysM domain
MTKTELVNNVVNTALAEVGYCEKASNANLDSKTANAGSANYTKYAKALAAAGYYNGSKNGYAWCDVFVDWVFFVCFGKTEGQLMEYQTSSLGAACPYSASYYKGKGQYYQWSSGARVGDQIFFQENGALVHTGLVVSVSSSAISTVEGNSCNKVARHTYGTGNAYVAGFGRPDYEAYTTEDEPAPVTPTLVPAPAYDTYTVQKGDSLWSIAQRLLGNGSRYTIIRALNRMKSNLIVPGQKIKVPSRGARIYTVQRGDSLWRIAEKLLGSGARWKEIQKLNDMASDLIVPEQAIKIPIK